MKQPASHPWRLSAQIKAERIEHRKQKAEAKYALSRKGQDTKVRKVNNQMTDRKVQNNWINTIIERVKIKEEIMREE